MKTIIDDLKNQSEHVSVRKLEKLATDALAKRLTVASEFAELNKDGIPFETKGAARREALGKHMEDVHAVDGALQAALADITKAIPPIPSADAGTAAIDAEQRALFRSASEESRNVLLRDPAMRMALARAPATLSGLPPIAHASIVDDVRRAVHPDEMAAHDADLRVVDAARMANDMHRQTARGTLGNPTFSHETKVTAA